jgi:ABC-type sulfate/molybdate transport systems ATPase subunit
MSWQVSIAAKLGSLNLEVDIHTDSATSVIIGPNGSGKTTLLRIIAGAYSPDQGRISVGGRILFDDKQLVDLPPEEREVGYVPQGYGLFPHLSVAANVAYGLRKTAAESRKRTVLEFLEEMECADLADRMPSSLSGGEQQRVALARALILFPKLVLLDEPLGALDASARRRMRGFLASHLRKRATPTIVVTHDVRDIVALDAHVLVLENGVVVQSGTPLQLKENPATDFVAEFFDHDLAKA